MTDAPERIWVEKSIAEKGNHGSTAWPNTDDDDDSDIAYRLEDVVQAMVAAAYEDAAKITDGMAAAEQEVNNPYDAEMLYHVSKRLRALTPAIARTAYDKAIKEAEARGRAEAEAKIYRLRKALGNIARQKRTDELETVLDVEYADFEGGYDCCIDVARAALAQEAGE